MKLRVDFNIGRKRVHWVEIPDIKGAGPIIVSQLVKLMSDHDVPMNEIEMTFHPQQE